MTRPRLNERQLECFYETMACGSLRMAAERMNIETSVVSRHLQQLQAQLGVRLLERRGRGVAPTEAAQRLFTFCQERQAREEEVLAALADQGGTLHGRIHIVSSEGLMDDLMRWVLGAFCVEHPRLEVTLEQANAHDAVQRVAQDQADCGAVYCAQSDPFVEVIQARRQPVHVVMPPDHPCATLPGPVSLAEAVQYPIALMSSGFGLHHVVHRAALADNVRLHPRLVTNSVASLRNFVLAGLGVTFMSGLSIMGGGHAGRLVARRAGNPILDAADIRLLVRAGRPRSAAVTELLRFLQRMSAAWEA